MNFPFELIQLIATRDPLAWRALLATPEFGRYSLTGKAQKNAFSAFFSVVKTPVSIKTYFCGKLHSFDDIPSEVFHSEFSVTKRWHLLGKLQRLNDKPAVVICFEDAVSRYWYRQGLLHRDNDLPAVVEIEDDDHVAGYLKKMWYQDGFLCRDNDKPTGVEYIGDYKCKLEWMNRDGEMHREKGPAIICFSDSGLVYLKEWYQNNVPFRKDDLPTSMSLSRKLDNSRLVMTDLGVEILSKTPGMSYFMVWSSGERTRCPPEMNWDEVDADEWFEG